MSEIIARNRKMEIRVDFADSLYFLRSQYGLSQREVEAACGLAPTLVSQYENYRRSPSLENLIKIKRGLGCEWDDLL